MEPTKEEMVKAFAEWHRRWTREPERFMKESEEFEMDAENYGEGAARYFASIIADLRSESPKEENAEPAETPETEQPRGPGVPR